MLSLFFTFSIIVNVILWYKNKELKEQLNRLRRIKERADSNLETISDSSIDSKNKELETDTLKNATSLVQLEEALNAEIELNDALEMPDVNTTLKHSSDSLYTQQVKKSEQESYSEYLMELHTEQADQKNSKYNFISHFLQLASGWHRSLIPFLVQNIGWFIGILCFISGSIFFVSYTEGFSKSITIFYTLLSYTVLLTWSGYHFKEKVKHASISGMVLMTISFLLIPINFIASARLLTASIEANSHTYFIISIISIVFSSSLLFYISKLISGIFNRHLLHHFSLIFFLMSATQLAIPLIKVSQNPFILFILYSIILLLLVLSIVYYLPIVLKQVFVERYYLILFSVGTLIFSSFVSMIHIASSSSIVFMPSFYSPLLMVLSMTLFYMDVQLNDYKEQSVLLSNFSLIAYACSFLAVFMSLDSALIRPIVLALSLLIYLRLMWNYYSLVPLYLVVMVGALLYSDIFLTNASFLFVYPLQYLYLMYCPLLFILLVMLSLLRRSEQQRDKSLTITRHLFHLIFIASSLLLVLSQWYCEGSVFSLLSIILCITSFVYLIKNQSINTPKLIGLHYAISYFYLTLLLPIVLFLMSTLISAEIKLLIIFVMSLCYAINAIYAVIRFDFFDISFYKASIKNKKLQREIFINSSLLALIVLLILVAIGFSLSMKIAILLFFASLMVLFLSIKLYNRALFYIFMLLVSLSGVMMKMYFNDSYSTGLLLMVLVFILFYLLSVFEKNKDNELEHVYALQVKKDNPKKILWFYPMTDYLNPVEKNHCEAMDKEI